MIFIKNRWILFHTGQRGNNQGNDNKKGRNNKRVNGATSTPGIGILPNYEQIAIEGNTDNTINRVQRAVKGYGFSASRYSLEELSAKKHDYELLSDEDNSVFVHIDSRTMGVGGYDSWTRSVDEEYLITPEGKKMTTSFRFVPILE
jgi:hypothetical protein